MPLKLAWAVTIHKTQGRMPYSLRAGACFEINLPEIRGQKGKSSYNAIIFLYLMGEVMKVPNRMLSISSIGSRFRSDPGLWGVGPVEGL